MNNKKARAIRKAMRDVKSENGAAYEQILHPYTLPGKDGPITGNMVTLRCTGAKRAYKLGKKIYKRFGVLPKKVG
jgi:hypothetical protein